MRQTKVKMLRKNLKTEGVVVTKRKFRELKKDYNLLPKNSKAKQLK